MYLKRFKTIRLLVVVLVAGLNATSVYAQAPTPENPSRYLQQTGGLAADAAVALALKDNGEIQALRNEVDAARALVKQARLRPNPKVAFNGSEQIGGMDNSQMAEVMLPLELGGRRAARVTVANRELSIRELALANQERLLASVVRVKFGESLAAIKRLEVAEKTLAAAILGYGLVSARVAEGKIAPLDQNIFLVEVNRLRSIRETIEGNVEVAMFELRNMIGMKPADPLLLRGDLTDLAVPGQLLVAATERALRDRPDLQGARAMEQLAIAQIEKARSDGRIDASVKTGYQRMNFGFPVSGFDGQGLLRPVQDVFHSLTFGVEIDLPVRNRNQGAVEAATRDREAARSRTEFGELTIRREVAASIARYSRAARSLLIFQNGVRDQANANLQVIWQTYELGSRSLLDYIAEQRRFLEIENALVDAELEKYMANIEVLRATSAPDLK